MSVYLREPLKLRDGTHTHDERLDRLREFDPRSRDFPFRTAAHAALAPRSKGWSVRRWLNQEQEGACVSFAWHHEAIAVPARATLYTAPDRSVNALAKSRYFDMQKLDDWPGGAYPGAEEYYGGTSTLAGAKLMQKLGYFDQYRWCFDLTDILLALSYEGPVVFAADWRENMYDPKPDGYLDISGEVVGGHCFLLSSVDVARKRVTMWNSWGEDWGFRGRAYISFDALTKLFYESGECCVPMNRRVV